MDDKNYNEVEAFVNMYAEHGITGLASFYGILEYAQFIEKIDFMQAKQLLYDFVGKMLLPESYE